MSLGSPGGLSFLFSSDVSVCTVHYNASLCFLKRNYSPVRRSDWRQCQTWRSQVWSDSLMGLAGFLSLSWSFSEGGWVSLARGLHSSPCLRVRKTNQFIGLVFYALKVWNNTALLPQNTPMCCMTDSSSRTAPMLDISFLYSFLGKYPSTSSCISSQWWYSLPPNSLLIPSRIYDSLAHCEP